MHTVIDVTTLGRSGPEMAYLIDKALVPAIKALAVSFCIGGKTSVVAR